MLCSALGKLDDNSRLHLYENVEGLQTWHIEHLEWDQKRRKAEEQQAEIRRQQETERRKRENQRQSALAKLTPEDKDALGIPRL